MKTAYYLRGLAVALAAGCLLKSAEAKKPKAGFEEFKGTYTGQTTTIIYGNSSYAATGNVTVSVPKNGASAVITVSGFLFNGGQGFPISNTFTVGRKTVSISNITYGVEPSLPPATGTGSLNSRGTVFTYTATFLTGEFSITGTIRVRPQGKKKKAVSVGMQFVASNNVYNFPFTAVGKATR